MIGILSDSHDNLNAVRAAAQLFKGAGCSLIIHAGDFVAPFSARALESAGCPVRAVFGNCDGERDGLLRALGGFGVIQSEPLLFSYAERTILVRHHDGGLEKICREKKPNVLVYGHSHRAEIRFYEETLIINPGEAGGWVHGRCTIALLDETAGTAEIIAL